ncbi:WGS project CAEQ00000000 data, annotated contig 2392 [Burkholderiales bacterium GJ-E10]|nr:WGS project CAEQ00000000 data, annotated contig 2392 [Burkholderiales bacterium GJ-E10]
MLDRGDPDAALIERRCHAGIANRHCGYRDLDHRMAVGPAKDDAGVRRGGTQDQFDPRPAVQADADGARNGA